MAKTDAEKLSAVKKYAETVKRDGTNGNEDDDIWMDGRVSVAHQILRLLED